MSPTAVRRLGVAAMLLGALLVVVRALTWFGWSLRMPTSGWLVPVGVALIGLGVLMRLREPVARYAVGGVLLAIACLGSAVLWLFGGSGTTNLVTSGSRVAAVTSVPNFGAEMIHVIEVRRQVGPLVRIQEVGCVSDDALGFGGVTWQGSSLVVRATRAAGEGDEGLRALVAVDDDGHVARIDDPDAILRSCGDD